MSHVPYPHITDLRDQLNDGGVLLALLLANIDTIMHECLILTLLLWLTPPLMVSRRFRRNNLLGQEAAFNLGRAYQQLNLMHLAVPYYEHALQLATARDLETVAESAAAGASPSATARTVGLEREAAYNLFQIYRSHKGSERLAREILRRHLTI